MDQWGFAILASYSSMEGLKKLKIVSLLERKNWKSLIAKIEFISLDIIGKKFITFVNFEPIRLLDPKQTSIHSNYIYSGL